jgi:hypothetical protein
VSTPAAKERTDAVTDKTVVIVASVAVLTTNAPAAVVPKRAPLTAAAPNSAVPAVSAIAATPTTTAAILRALATVRGYCSTCRRCRFGPYSRLMRALILAALLLSACASTADMAQLPPDRTYQSAKSRADVSECLLNRLSDPGVHPERTITPSETTVAFSSAGGITHPAIYVFKVSDAANGSLVQVRTMHGLARMDLSTAETCF